jgi:hypothetical protein
MEVFDMSTRSGQLSRANGVPGGRLVPTLRSLAGALLLLVVVPGLALAEYREVEVEDGGTIAGSVRFRGELPEDAIQAYPVSGKWPGCGTGYRKIVTIDIQGDALRGAFVMLDGIAAGKKWPTSRSVPEIDQQDCSFVPTHQVVRRGESITIRNSDSGVIHNVNMRELVEVGSGRTVGRMVFNITQPVVGESHQTVDPRESPFLTAGCDFHNFMYAHVVASDHPYAALVDDDGRFLFDDVPAGTYAAVAWHPRLGKKRASVTVPPNGVVELSFEFGM